MGHHSKRIDFQACERLERYKAYGESKHQAKKGGNTPPKNKIYSYETMKTYKDCCGQFARWAAKEHGCKNIDAARRYAGEYLQQRQDAGLSNWTLNKDACALGKLYQCDYSAFGYKPQTRHRADITEHRGQKWEGRYKEENHMDVKLASESSGLRVHELRPLRPEDVYQNGKGQTVVHVLQGKGGKEREVICTNDTMLKMAQEAADNGQELIFKNLPTMAPIHEYRQHYARELYQMLARPLETLEEKDLYRCRGDLAGHVYDRAAMQIVSYNLGHARLDVVTNYIF